MTLYYLQLWPIDQDLPLYIKVRSCWHFQHPTPQARFRCPVHFYASQYYYSTDPKLCTDVVLIWDPICQKKCPDGSWSLDKMHYLKFESKRTWSNREKKKSNGRLQSSSTSWILGYDNLPAINMTDVEPLRTTCWFYNRILDHLLSIRSNSSSSNRSYETIWSFL